MSDSELAELLSRCRSGDGEAISVLWSMYFRFLAEIARNRLSPPRHYRPLGDEEDVASEALYEFIDCLTTGKFGGIREEDELSKLLTTITLRRTKKLIRSAIRDPTYAARTAYHDDQNAAQNASDNLTASIRELIVDLCDHLDSTQQQVLQLRLDGHSLKEIAARLHVSVSAAHRRLTVIRHWATKVLDEDSA